MADVTGAARSRARPAVVVPSVRQAALALFLGAFAVLTALWLLRELRGLLVLVLFSLFLGFALEPAVTALVRRGWPRGRATGLVFLAFLLVTGTLAYLAVRLVVDQAQVLVEQLPGYGRQAAAFAEEELGVEISAQNLTQIGGRLGDFGAQVAGNAIGFGTSAFGMFIQVLTVLTLTYYFVADGPRMRRALCSVLPPARQREVLRVFEIAIARTASYVYYRTALAVLSTVVHGIAFAVLDVPFALSMAVWVGIVSQFVPTVGTYLAATLPLLLTLADSPGRAPAVLGFIVVYQQVENLLISPPLSARTMRVHPSVGLSAALAGVALIGPIGAILALPFVATVQAFVGTYVRRHEVVADDLTADDGAEPDETVKRSTTP